MRSFIAAILSLFALVFGGIGTATAQPVQPHPIPFMAGQVIPDITQCENSYDLPTRTSCAAALVNNELMALYGQTPNYSFIQEGAIGITQLGFDLSGPVACGYVSGILENMYCNRTINFGEQQLEMFQQETSDPQLAVALIGAHESGHFVQNVVGLVNLTPIFADPRVFPYEQWSDCFAGVVAERWQTQGIFAGDLREEGAMLFAGIAREGELSHGSPWMRRDAFYRGFDGGLAACGSPSVGLR